LWLDAAGFKGHIAAVTEEDVEPADTDHEKEHEAPRVRWGVVASVLLHVPIVALLIFGLPKIQPKPAEDESVKVELVPPPEEKKPEEKPQEQAKAEPPPSPPVEKAAEPAKRMPMPVLRPVTEYGEKNSSSQRSVTGNSSEGEAKPAETAPPHNAQADQPPAEAAAEKPQTETPPAKPVPDDVRLPEVATADISQERNAPLAELSGEAKTSIELAKPREPKPSEKPKIEPADDKLTEAKTLFSENDGNDPVARTLIDGLSRSQRVSKLCASELQQQLIHASPSFRPISVPSQGISSGTVLNLNDAFRTAEGWYEVSLRCEIDRDAMKVVSFAFKVGNAIPRSQWKKRGFPY